jgi:hypothetical protein
MTNEDLSPTALGKASTARANHRLCGGIHSLDVPSQVERFREQRIIRNRGVVVAQAFERKRARQSARIPNFKPISERAHFDRSIAVVIPVDDGVYDRLANSIRRQLVCSRRGYAVCASAKHLLVTRVRAFFSLTRIKTGFRIGYRLRPTFNGLCLRSLIQVGDVIPCRDSEPDFLSGVMSQ